MATATIMHGHTGPGAQIQWPRPQARPLPSLNATETEPNGQDQSQMELNQTKSHLLTSYFLDPKLAVADEVPMTMEEFTLDRALVRRKPAPSCRM